MAEALTIGQLAQATGVSARTIRYYEEVGVLPRPGRTPAGYRQYAQQGVHRLRFIRRARALGLPLQHLKALAAVLDGGPRATVRPQLPSHPGHGMAARQMAGGFGGMLSIRITGGDAEAMIEGATR